MTDDFKKKIFDYITGNYSVESGNNIPQFNTTISHTNNFATLFSSQFPYGYFFSTEMQGYNADNNGVGYTLIAGVYREDETAQQLRGFITILDNEFDIVQTITQYSNGTYLGNYVTLNVGDDGNFFGIENNSGVLRFTMLNNIIAKLPSETEYKIVLRQSYNVPNTSKLYTATASGIIKAPGIAKYCVYGNYYENTSEKPLVTEIEVNVGSSNTWTDYTYSGAVKFYASDCLPSWNSNGDLSFQMVGIENVGSGSNNYAFCMYSTTGSTSLTRQQIGSGLGVGNTMDMKILTANDIYACFSEFGLTTMNLYMYKVNVSNYTLNTFYTKTTPQVEGEYNSMIGIKKNGTELFYKVSASKDTTPTKMLYYFGKVIGSQAYEYYLGEFNPHLTTWFLVQKQFNLYDYYMQIENVVYDIKQVYNSLNYNGLPYQALNSMIPESSILYDENDKIAFARNLYNKTISGGTTTSTVEVPNNYLNDVSISKEELISETNSILNSDTTLIEKNIYEQLYINFINTLNVIDKNNTTQTLNPVGSSRINDSISETMDYENVKITKFIINYSDNTSDIRNFCSKTYSSTENRVTYSCIIYVPLDKSISNIQIKSNDENTTYLTIDTSSLVSGKYYRLSQDLVVE